MIGLNNKATQVHYSGLHAFGNHQVNKYFITAKTSANSNITTNNAIMMVSNIVPPLSTFEVCCNCVSLVEDKTVIPVVTESK